MARRRFSQKTNEQICFVCFFCFSLQTKLIRWFIFWENLRRAKPAFGFIWLIPKNFKPSNGSACCNSAVSLLNAAIVIHSNAWCSCLILHHHYHGIQSRCYFYTLPIWALQDQDKFLWLLSNFYLHVELNRNRLTCY